MSMTNGIYLAIFEETFVQFAIPYGINVYTPNLYAYNTASISSSGKSSSCVSTQDSEMTIRSLFTLCFEPCTSLQAVLVRIIEIGTDLHHKGRNQRRCCQCQ